MIRILTFRSIFWLPSAISIAHESDLKFLDVVDEGWLVREAHISIKSMKGNSLRLSNGSSIYVDTVIFATGWRPAHSGILDSSLRLELGLPVSPDSLSDHEKTY